MRGADAMAASNTRFMRTLLEAAAAGCMSEQGWPYQPWTSFELFSDTALSAPPLGTPEFAAERGYGLFFASGEAP
jgi:hypothetical protein